MTRFVQLINLGTSFLLCVAPAAFSQSIIPGLVSSELDPELQGQAKMGALFSGFVGFAALALGRMFGFGKQDDRQD